MNKVYLDNGLKFKEVKACENFGNYTGDNEDEKCYLLNENEYVIADGDTEVFAPLEENESIAIAVKDDNRLVVRGDIEALNCFALLYETGYLEDSDIHIYSNNYFDLDLFYKAASEVGGDIEVDFVDYTDNENDISINVTGDSIKVSTGYGEIETYGFETKKDIRHK